MLQELQTVISIFNLSFNFYYQNSLLKLNDNSCFSSTFNSEVLGYFSKEGSKNNIKPNFYNEGNFSFYLINDMCFVDFNLNFKIKIYCKTNVNFFILKIIRFHLKNATFKIYNEKSSRHL